MLRPAFHSEIKILLVRLWYTKKIGGKKKYLIVIANIFCEWNEKKWACPEESLGLPRSIRLLQIRRVKYLCLYLVKRKTEIPE
jgi:hypothetical protein